MSKPLIFLISVSGGKDSQACWNYVLEHHSEHQIQAYTADTGWEHRDTYKHLAYLESKLGKIDVVKSNKFEGFEDMCIQKKMFPNRITKFCTSELKIIPSEEYIRSWIAKDYQVINVTGVRANESHKRSGQGKWKTTFLGAMPYYRTYKGEKKAPSKRSMTKYFAQSNSITVYQPIIYWDATQVLQYNLDKGTKNNPLYKQGFTRVGCMPCINARVAEIGNLPKDYLERVRALEEKVSSVNTCGKATFFQKNGESIDELFNKYNQNPLDLDLGCVSPYGLCE